VTRKLSSRFLPEGTYEGGAVLFVVARDEAS
jgi:hypothetical protein